MRLLACFSLILTSVAHADTFADFLDGRSRPAHVFAFRAVDGDLAFTRSGDPVIEGDGSALPPPQPVWVFEQQDGWLRFSTTNGDVMVVFWGQASQLATVMKRDLVVFRGKGKVKAMLGAGARVSFAAGTVTYDGEGLHVEGTAPEDAVGVTYTSGGLPMGGIDAEVPGETTLLDAPGGKPFASLSVPDPVQVHRIGKPRKKHQLVQVRRGQAVVTGWVEASQVTKWVPRPGVDTYDRGVPPEKHGTLLAKGTRLYGAPDGSLVGTVLTDHEPEVVEQRDGWTAWRLKLGGHSLVLWSQ